MGRLGNLKLVPCLAALALIIASNGPSRAAPLTAVVFDVESVESQIEGPSGITKAQLAAATAKVHELIEKSGAVTLVDLAPAADEIAKNLPLHTCRDCDLDIAKKLGADIEFTTAIQRSSPGITTFSASVRDVKTGRVVRSGVVDVRGSDEAVWSHGLKFLVRDRLLDPPLPADSGALRAAIDKAP